MILPLKSVFSGLSDRFEGIYHQNHLGLDPKWQQKKQDKQQKKNVELFLFNISLEFSEVGHPWPFSLILGIFIQQYNFYN